MKYNSETLAETRDMSTTYAELSATLGVTRDAVSMCLDRAVRRTVLALGALIVAAGVAAVLVAWLFS